MKSFVAVTYALFLSLALTRAFAFDFHIPSAHIYYVEVEYMPSVIVFTIDLAADLCAAGTQLFFNAANAGQARAVLTTLLTSRVSGVQIRLYGNNAGCSVTNVLFG